MSFYHTLNKHVLFYILWSNFLFSLNLYRILYHQLYKNLHEFHDDIYNKLTDIYQLLLVFWIRVIIYLLPAAVKMFGKGIGCHCLYSNQHDNGPSCRVSDSLKNVSSCFHFLNICNYLVANIYAIDRLRKFILNNWN